MAAEKSLVKILDKAWAIKQDLSPQDETGQRKLMLEFIRSEFSEELEKKDCQSIVTCLKLLIFKHITTLAAAKRIFPKFKRIIPFLYKSTSYNSSEIEFSNIRRLLSPRLKEYGDSIFKTTTVQKEVIARYAQENLEKKLSQPFKISLNVLLENIAKDIQSEDYAVVASALEASSGSRLIEILSSRVATFKESKTPEYIIQTGKNTYIHTHTHSHKHRASKK